MEIQEKVLDYLTAGTELVWVADPHTRTVMIYGSSRESRLLTLGNDLDGGDVVPGFRIALTDLFEYVAPSE